MIMVKTSPPVRSTMVLGWVLIWLLTAIPNSHARPVKIIVDTDMLTDPEDLPIVFSGYEIGGRVISGKSYKQELPAGPLPLHLLSRAKENSPDERNDKTRSRRLYRPVAGSAGRAASRRESLGELPFCAGCSKGN
jgi:hypothetical protein